MSPDKWPETDNILAEVKKAKHILLHCHPSPDPDSVGSVLAMKFALEQLGKKVTAIQGDSEIPRAFMHFPGAGEIVKKNFFEIDISEFDLFIILDSGSPNMVSKKNSVSFPLPIRSIVIDHHASNEGYGDINLIDTSSPATAFILYNLFNDWNIKIDHPIAINLIIGMYTDTGGFKYPPTDHRVLSAAAELAKIAPDYTKFLFVLENSNEKEFIYFQALALSSIKTFLDGNLVISSVSKKELDKNGIKAENTRGITNLLKSAIGWNLSASLVEIEPEKIKISFGTRDSEKYDVSKLAVELGGGGHKAAAGAVLNMPLEQAIEKVVSTAKIMYNL